MSSKWFDLDEELSPELFAGSSGFESLKRDLMFSSRKTEREKSWRAVNKVSDILDLDTGRSGILSDRSKCWDSVIKDRLAGTRNRLSGRMPMSDTECDDIWSDISSRRMRNRLSQGAVDLRSETDDRRREKVKSCTKKAAAADTMHMYHSDGNYGFFDVTGRKIPDDDARSRKSSCQGIVSFPSSSNASVISDAPSEKSFGRSVSMNSEESVCTEKSADCTTISETLPDGSNKTQYENSEIWLTKSSSGSLVSEKKVKDSSVTEKSEDKVCDKTTQRTTYVEKSATGSSLREESTSERTISCDKKGSNTVEQKMSSETYKKAYRSPGNSSIFYNELDSCAFQQRMQNLLRSGDEDLSDLKRGFASSTAGKTISEKVSRLIDEAVHQDNLFKLETDMNRMSSDFAEVKAHFGKERKRNGRRRFSGCFESGKRDDDMTWSKFTELKAENETLLQENSKLQSIIQDVTAVNKRWQKYNNERRLYVQKLLSTIQDLQEQINLISEKSAFRRTNSDESNSLYQDIEKLKREYQEHITVLELQIKSHKDDWDAERKEKQKAVHEKEDLEQKVQELLREIKFLSNIIMEGKGKPDVCSTCSGNLDKAMVFPGREIFPNESQPNCFMPNTYRTGIQVPHKKGGLSPSENYISEYHSSKEEFREREKPCFSAIDDSGESYLNQRFSECTNFNQSKKTPGDTIVVEDENGLRLSITEQFPTKDSLQLKSILKRTDRKMKLLSQIFPEEGDITNSVRKQSADERNVTCKDCETGLPSGCTLKIGFEKSVTPFSPYPVQDEIASLDYGCANSEAAMEFLRVTSDSRSKSEPNIRSNSSENLKPLRESSSWNNQCSHGEENAVCSGCDHSFSPSIRHPHILDHFEPRPDQRNHY